MELRVSAGPVCHPRSLTVSTTSSGRTERGRDRSHILLPQIQGRFDVFLTIDKGFEFEHNLEKLSFGVIVLEASNNQMTSYERLLNELVEQIRSAVPGRVVRVSDPEL